MVKDWAVCNTELRYGQREIEWSAKIQICGKWGESRSKASGSNNFVIVENQGYKKKGMIKEIMEENFELKKDICYTGLK